MYYEANEDVLFSQALERVIVESVLDGIFVHVLL